MMNAIHLPGCPPEAQPPYSFPDHPPEPSALQYTAVNFPSPRTDAKPCFLVRVLTTSLTRGELTWGEVLAPARFRPSGGAIPGHDFVGIIEKSYSSGNNDIQFKEGDRVWGFVDFDRDGAAADYVVALENELCLAPSYPKGTEENRWNELLATLPISALTAWQALFVHGGLHEQKEKNDRTSGVIILGSGAVARAAIELATWAGIFLKVVASSRGAETLVVDYVPSHLSKGQIIEDGPQLLQDLTSDDTEHEKQEPTQIELVIDTVGGSLVTKLLTGSQLHTLLRPGGRFVSIAAPLSVYGADIGQSIKTNCEAAQVSCHFFVVRPNKDELEKISRIVEDGHLSGCVESVWPLEKGREAMERVNARGVVKKGKVVLVSVSHR
jgi:NADPH:quinone reductase-like Zn-dependent oxidoreductase